MISTSPQRSRPRVIIVGAGFAGLVASRRLRHVPVDIVLVDRTNHHLFQPLLYQVATGILPPGEIAPPLRKIMRRQPNTTVELGEVTDIELDRREVAVCGAEDSPHRISYDYLIVAAGAEDSYFGHDQWAPHLYPMKALAQALRLRDQVLTAYQRAATCTDAEERTQWTTFAIVGAGPTGVEIAGQLATLARELQPEFSAIDPARGRIVLIDALDDVLTSFPPTLRRHTIKRLTRLEVDILLGAMVSDVDEREITVTTNDGRTERIQTHTVIWAAGVQASPLARTLGTSCGAEVDHKGRVKVRPDCSLPGHPDVFVIGDLANLDNLPGLCEPAMQQGSYVAKVLHHRVTGKPEPGAFTYRDLGMMATISPSDAVADVFGLELRGYLGKLAWAVVHIAFLVGWSNRAAVLARWIFLLLSPTRPNRTITAAFDHHTHDRRPGAARCTGSPRWAVSPSLLITGVLCLGGAALYALALRRRPARAVSE